jgi:hypothetical protein
LVSLYNDADRIISGMAAKKTKGRKMTAVAKGRARERGETATFMTEFDPELLSAIDSFVAGHRPKTTRRSVLEMMAEEFLEKRGLWPRSEAAD